MLPACLFRANVRAAAIRRCDNVTPLDMKGRNEQPRPAKEVNYWRRLERVERSYTSVSAASLWIRQLAARQARQLTPPASKEEGILPPSLPLL